MGTNRNPNSIEKSLDKTNNDLEKALNILSKGMTNELF
jgi:hypothetical protein